MTTLLPVPNIVGRRRALAGAAPTGFLLAAGAGGWLGKGIDVGRWVVGDDQVVVENVAGGRISVHIPSGTPLVGDWPVIEDLVVKAIAALLVAAGEADRVDAFQEVVAAVSAARQISSERQRGSDAAVIRQNTPPDAAESPRTPADAGDPRHPASAGSTRSAAS